jgi:hypothetical protein
MAFDFISGMDLGKLIAAGVLAPALGLAGTKIKELLEARDVRQRSKRLMEEVTDLLAFAEILQKSANSGVALANIPAESLATLQAAIAERVNLAVTHISLPSAVRIQQRHLARDVLDRLLLLHRPLVWWAWPMHAVYYALLGILGAMVAFIISDFRSNDADKWYGVLGTFLVILLPLVILNLLMSLIDRRKFSKMMASQPTNTLIHLSK